MLPKRPPLRVPFCQEDTRLKLLPQRILEVSFTGPPSSPQVLGQCQQHILHRTIDNNYLFSNAVCLNLLGTPVPTIRVVIASRLLLYRRVLLR
jgi:hypothetical protein